MDEKTFWQLGWNDLIMWLEKLVHDRKKRNEDRELQMEMTRQMMCLTANINRGNRAPFRPQDFMKLSYDEIGDEKDARTAEEILSKFPKTIKRIDGK